MNSRPKNQKSGRRPLRNKIRWTHFGHICVHLSFYPGFIIYGTNVYDLGIYDIKKIRFIK